MHAQCEQGKAIDVGVLIVHVYNGSKKVLNRTLAIDSHFQTFAEDFSSNL